MEKFDLKKLIVSILTESDYVFIKYISSGKKCNATRIYIDGLTDESFELEETFDSNKLIRELQSTYQIFDSKSYDKESNISLLVVSKQIDLNYIKSELIKEKNKKKRKEKRKFN